jgi:hypothetical protein
MCIIGIFHKVHNTLRYCAITVLSGNINTGVIPGHTLSLASSIELVQHGY